MSFRQIVKVWDYQFTAPQQAVMQAMAEHADDEGNHVFPSVARIAWKSRYSKRQVQRVMGELREMGVLQVVRQAEESRPTEYRFDWPKAKRRLTFAESQAKIGLRGGGDNLSGGDTVSSETVKLSKDQIPKPPIEVSNSKTLAQKLISAGERILTVWAEEKRPEWIDHKSVSDQAGKHLAQFRRELRKLGITGEQQLLDAFRVAMKQAAREDWTRTNLTMDNLGTKGKWFQFYEKGLAAGLGVSGAGAESPFNPPPTSGVATSPSHGLSGAPAYLSADERLSLAWRHVHYRTTGELFEARIAGIDLDPEVTSREFSQDGVNRHPVSTYYLSIDRHLRTEAPVKFAEHTQEDVAAYLGQTLAVSVDDVIFNPPVSGSESE